MPNASAITNTNKNLSAGNRLERAFLIDRAFTDIAARTVTLAFASEMPYQRYWGNEILDCTATAMRQNRLLSGANLLLEHCPDDVVGVVESVSIGADRVARAVVRFGKSVDAEEIFQDVLDGIRRNVSVGYMIHAAQLVETVDGLETYRVTDWEPLEISLVAIPADPNVGIGRNLDQTENEANAINAINNATNTDPASAIQSAQANTKTLSGKTMSTTNAIEVIPQRNHPLEISKIAASLPSTINGHELALKSIQEGHTVEQFQDAVMRAFSNKPIATADLGMSNKEVKRYSIMRALIAASNPSDRGLQDAAAFEFECASEMSKVMGRQAEGFYVPYEVLNTQRQFSRDLTVGNAANGGNLKATELMSGNFIDMLRNQMVMGSLGIQYLGGLVGDVDIPRQNGTASTYWLAEQGAPNKSNLTIDKINLSPKSVGAKTIISRKMRQQGSLDMETLVQNDLAAALAIEMERAIINGSGLTGVPLGLLNTPGIGLVVGGANGAAPNLGHIIDLETAVSMANARLGNLAYLTNSKVCGKLKKTFIDSPGSGIRVWENFDRPLNSYRAEVTNLMPSNLTKGTSNGICSSIAFGNFSDVLVGMWGGLDLLVDKYTGGDAGDVSVRVIQDMDVGFRHLESFAVMKDALAD